MESELKIVGWPLVVVGEAAQIASIQAVSDGGRLQSKIVILTFLDRHGCYAFINGRWTLLTLWKFEGLEVDAICGAETRKEGRVWGGGMEGPWLFGCLSHEEIDNDRNLRAL